MSLNIQFWVVPRSGPAVRLATPSSWDFARVAGEPGAIRLDYPTTGPGFAVLRSIVDDDTDLAVEIRVDGTSATALGGLLTDAEGDDVKPGAVWTFTGEFNEALMRDMVIPYNPADENGETHLAGTPGGIVATLMLAAHQRGTDHVGYASFSDTHDSNGSPWPTTLTSKSSPGRDYLDVLKTFERYGHLEWEVTRDRELRLYVADTQGVDRTTGPSPLMLQWGRDLGDAPRRYTSRGAPNVLVASGADGLYAEKSNAAAVARMGRRREGYQSFGSAAHQSTLDLLTQRQVDLISRGQMELSHTLVLHPAAPSPLIDYTIRDTVLSATSAGRQALVVQQISISGDDKGVRTAAATLGTLIDSQQVTAQRQIDALASGELVAGTSTPPPDTDHGKNPKAPAGLSVSSLAGYDEQGDPYAAVSASWLPVNQNDDGSAAFDISGYVVEYRYLSPTLPDGWVTAARTSQTSVTWSPMLVAQPVEVRVACYNRWDHQSVWSAPVAATTASDADPPPQPAAPIVSPYIGILTVHVSGEGSAGEPMPSDFRATEIHMSTSAVFVPDRPLKGDGTLDDGASTTFVGRVFGADTFPVALGTDQDGVEHFFRLVAVDRVGNASSPSAVGSGVPGLVEDGDVRELNVGKLRTGILSALMTVSGMIRTGLTGARVELDSTGFRCYAADGTTVLFEFHIPTSLLSLIGTFQTGRSGRRIALSGEGNDLRFYPQTGETRYARMYSYIPSNFPDDIAVETRAIDSDTTDLIARSYLLPDSAALAVTPVGGGGAELQVKTRVLVGPTEVVLEAAEPKTPPNYTVRAKVLAAHDGVARVETRDTDGAYTNRVDLGAGGQSYEVRTGGSRDGGWIVLDRTSGNLGVQKSGVSSQFEATMNRVAAWTRLGGSGMGARMYAAEDTYTHIGTTDSSSIWGFEHTTSGIINLRCGDKVQVTNPALNSWRPIHAAAFEQMSGAAVKEEFEVLPSSALAALRGAPVTRWRYRGDDPTGPARVGPVVEDLPDWLAIPGEPVERVELVEQPGGLDEDGNPLPSEYVTRSVPSDLPVSDRVDLLSMIGTLWAAVRELDAELDEYRRTRGRPAPPRREVADLLADIRAGRLPGHPPEVPRG